MPPTHPSIHHLLLLTLALTLLIPTTPQLYQLPPTTSPQQNIRLNSIHILNEPNLQLRKIYKTQIHEVKFDETQGGDSQSVASFQACRQSPPEISFQPVGFVQLQVGESDSYGQSAQQSQQQSVIYDFDVLKSQYRNVVDMTFYSDHVFTITSTGVINVYRVNQREENSINQIASVDAINWDQLVSRRTQRFKQALKNKNISSEGKSIHSQDLPQSLKFHHIQKGYFEFMDKNQLLLFSNGELLIGFDVRTFKASLLSEQKTIELWDFIDEDEDQDDDDDNQADQRDDEDKEEDFQIVLKREYETLQDFESVTKIDQNHFAVLDRKKGATIYKIYKDRVSLGSADVNYEIERIDFIGRKKFGKAFVSKQEMNLVDIKYSKELKLLLILDFDMGVFAFNKQNFQLESVDSFTFSLNANTIFKKQCNLMQFSQPSQSLFLSCNKIYRISLGQWPLISEKVYPHPMINVRQIFVEEERGILVFAGYSTFKLMYLDRPVSYFEDDLLDKIVFQNQLAVTANEFGIAAYKYQIDVPSIVCQTINQSLIGVHSVVIKTMAECQQQFLKQVNKTQEQKSRFDSEDICVYTVYKNLYIWEQGEVPETNMTIFFVVIGVLCAIMVLWAGSLICRTRRARRYLQTLVGQGNAPFVEEVNDVSQNVNSQKSIGLVDENIGTSESMNKATGKCTYDESPQKI